MDSIQDNIKTVQNTISFLKCCIKCGEQLTESGLLEVTKAKNAIDEIHRAFDNAMILRSTLVNIRDCDDPSSLTWDEMRQLAKEAVKTFDLIAKS